MKEQIASTILNEDDGYDVSRRHFLQLAGGLTGVGVLFAACNKGDSSSVNTTGAVKLGSGDIGILNYAYALEQLEAAFYSTVVSNSAFTSIFNSDEQILFTDIRDHEIAHREFFKAALGSGAIKGLTPNFSTIDFTNRASVLATAQAFEDLGVSAYNGAGKLISNVDYLLVAGKIVSVEARHAAYIRDLKTPGSFSDTVDNATGLDVSNPPSVVLATAGQYITDTIDASQLPQ